MTTSVDQLSLDQTLFSRVYNSDFENALFSMSKNEVEKHKYPEFSLLHSLMIAAC